MDEVRRLHDPGVGDWLRPRLVEWRAAGARGVPVGAVVPTGYEAVVRVLHPPGDGRTWAQVAAASGCLIHPLAQWCCIAADFRGDGRHSDIDPDEGSVPASTLGAVLDHCPGEGRLYQAVWDGFGSWTEGRHELGELVRGRGRDYLVFETPRAPVTRWPGMQPHWPQSANLVWPPDRAWCIATEIDWDSTLVAGSAAMCRALLGDARLEAFEVHYDDDLSWCGDTLNPRPGWLTGCP